MRPRPEGRGELDLSRGVGLRQALGLQCGHNPKAVENPTRGRRPWTTGRRLQCGHNPEAVENNMPWRTISTMPWPLQCGHDPEAVENSPSTPRPCSAARRFNAATTRRPWRTRFPRLPPRATDALQCGHNPEAVENVRHDPRRGVADDGFNAATTRRPWRTATDR